MVKIPIFKKKSNKVAFVEHIPNTMKYIVHRFKLVIITIEKPFIALKLILVDY